MRISIRVAIILAIFSGHALANGKKAAHAPKAGAGMMDSNDPAEKETSDEGPFGPKHKSDEEEARERQAEIADQPEVIKPRARDQVAVFGNVLIGFGKAPEPGPGGDYATGQATSVTFMAGGHYDVSPKFTVGIRIPWTAATVDPGDGSSASAQALGAPELMVEYRVALGSLTRLPLDFGIGVPVAQGNYDAYAPAFRQAWDNDIADAASGYRDGELFGPKRLPLVAGLGIDYDRKALGLHAATKFVAGVKIGGELVFPVSSFGTYELKSVTFRNVTSAGISYQFLDKPILFGALDSWVAYKAVDAVEFNSNAGATAPTRFQVAFEPRLGARFGKISPNVGYIFPIGGRLADNHTSGLELHCDVAF